jgi:hypothetical protein
MAVLIFLLLLDFIEPQQGNGAADPAEWDRLCLRLCWQLLSRSEALREYLKTHPRGRLLPDFMTANEELPWQHVTMFTLAVACRSIARFAVV